MYVLTLVCFEAVLSYQERDDDDKGLNTGGCIFQSYLAEFWCIFGGVRVHEGHGVIMRL